MSDATPKPKVVRFKIEGQIVVDSAFTPGDAMADLESAVEQLRASGTIEKTGERNERPESEVSCTYTVPHVAGLKL